MTTSETALDGVDIYQGCRTPSDHSVFSASSPEPSFGSHPSAREIYEGLRTPDWLDSSSWRSSESEVIDDLYLSATGRRTKFGAVFTACFGRPEPEKGRDSSDQDADEDLVPTTERALEVTEQNDFSVEADFTYDEIVRITKGFDHVFGRGEYGIVYPGQTSDGTRVAVKMFTEKLSASAEFCNQFKLQAQLFKRLKHRNLVSIIGYCCEGSRMGLVLENMPQGNLRTFLIDTDGKRKPLTWVQRVQIALDVAQGLEFLHFGCTPPVIHGNIKLTNILLDEGMEAKLTDFWFTKAFDKEYLYEDFLQLKSSYPEKYPDFESFMSVILYKKNDVYSFGKVLLQLVTGQQGGMKESDLQKMGKTTLLPGIRSLGTVVDPRLQGDYDIKFVSQVVQIATACIEKQMTMGQVVTELRTCLGRK
ncbi:hypothetical protein H6P81_017241 [Aristolochia fimbriata]|uniref:Protein kinase domain-containing protein n=1 Tax=Aristolochia fimbriata TaxID=158543 RepID=A0AAV7E1X9_ARIFI|nr:hypothetical protein H6P81_017241 [Aristolochia fimbriata]